ncbi:hypothetical protein Tco_0672808 [Tanacetum coccineum]
MNASTKNMGENNRGADKCSRSYGGAMGSGKSYVNVLKSSNVVESSSPALVIDDAFVVRRELDNYVYGEGVPLHAWSRATFQKIGSKWGEVMDLEESKELFVWSPVFKEPENVEYCSDTKSEKEGVVKDGNDDGGILDAESEVEEVSETNFGDLHDGLDADHVESTASLSEDTVVSNGQIKEKGLRNGGSILEVLDDMIYAWS